MNIRTQIGAKIRELRQKKSLTIEELAFRAGVHSNYLGDIERGDRNPSIESMVKISNGLRVKIGELFEATKGAGKSAGTPDSAKGAITDLSDESYRYTRSILKLFRDKSPEGRRFILGVVKKLSKKIK